MKDRHDRNISTLVSALFTAAILVSASVIAYAMTSYGLYSINHGIDRGFIEFNDGWILEKEDADYALGTLPVMLELPSGENCHQQRFAGRDKPAGRSFAEIALSNRACAGGR